MAKWRLTDAQKHLAEVAEKAYSQGPQTIACRVDGRWWFPVEVGPASRKGLPRCRVLWRRLQISHWQTYCPSVQRKSWPRPLF